MFRSIDRATCRSREHSHSSCCHNKLNQSKVDLCLEQLIVSKTLGCVAKKIILRLIASIQQPAWMAWTQQRMSTSRKEKVVTVVDTSPALSLLCRSPQVVWHCVGAVIELVGHLHPSTGGLSHII